MDTYQISRSDRLRAHARTYLQKMGIKLFKRTALRFGVSGAISVALHTVLFALLLVASLLNSRQALEIREIEFVDLSEDLAEDNPFEGAETALESDDVQAQESDPAAATAESGAESRSAADPARTANPQPLDMSRKQAPINLANMAPLVLGTPEAEEELKISPARGTRRDEKIVKWPRSIDLNSKSYIKLAEKPSAPLPSGESGRPPGIVLARAGNANEGMENLPAGPVLVSKRPVQTKEPASSPKNMPVAVPAKSKTFITGPLASRGILYKCIPEFPRSAKRRGIGATISLRFTVMETGEVKENVIVVRTSGSKQWDDEVIAALKKWRFKPLPVLGRKDQSGIITFQFVLE